jgi:hypothetical protein
MFFEQIFPTFLEESNCYFHQDLAAQIRPSTCTQRYGNVQTIQTGHNQKPSIRDYWSQGDGDLKLVFRSCPVWICQDTRHLDCDFMFFLSPSRQILASYFKLGHDCFLPHLLQSIAY